MEKKMKEIFAPKFKIDDFVCFNKHIIGEKNLLIPLKVTKVIIDKKGRMRTNSSAHTPVQIQMCECDLPPCPTGQIGAVCATAIDIDEYIVVLFRVGPFEEPPRIHDREVDTAMTLAVAKAIMPVGTMQADISVKIHHVRHFFDEIEVSLALCAAHTSCFVALIDLI